MTTKPLPTESSSPAATFPHAPIGLVQPITVNVTEDYNADTRAKIFGKLRREAVKLGADAVVMVTKGISR